MNTVTHCSFPEFDEESFTKIRDELKEILVSKYGCLLESSIIDKEKINESWAGFDECIKNLLILRQLDNW